MLREDTFKSKFSSKNVINNSKKNLPSEEISLLSKGIKFVHQQPYNKKD